MKEYIRRLKNGCTKGQLVLWWVYRLLMIYALIVTALKNPSDIVLTAQLTSGFIGMFLWEMCMATRENSFTRFIPSFLQTGFIICIFVAAFDNINACGENVIIFSPNENINLNGYKLYIDSVLFTK